MRHLLILILSAGIAGAQTAETKAKASEPAKPSKSRQPAPAEAKAATAQPAGPKADAAQPAAVPAKGGQQRSDGSGPSAAAAPKERRQPARHAKANDRPAQRPKIKVSPDKRQEPPEAKPPQAAAPATPTRQPASETPLAAVGALTLQRGADFEVTGVVPGSEAESMGLLPGDRLTHLGASALGTAKTARDSVQGLAPGTRLYGVAVRGLGTQPLAGKALPLKPAFVRSPEDLSAHEATLKERLMTQGQTSAEAAVKNAPRQEFKILAGQSFWVRFPKGIPVDAKPGDVLSGEATTAVCTDQSLDFLSLPPKSLFWAKLVEANGPSQTRNLRPFFFKMKLQGGSYYPIAARVVDISGDQRLIRVSPGGTVVMAYNEDLSPDLKIKVELVEPVTIIEPPGFYGAGPGLWIKTRDDGPGFKVSHVIPGRSAQSLGLKTGDVIMAIDGSKASTFDFASALAAIYGRAGTEVKLGVIRSKDEPTAKEKSETVTLKRGVTIASGDATPLPLPYAPKDGKPGL
ncbi:MAG: PDZ domain-containing protein [Elusimicrobia bacterium]|nr:PDZ domain-containing protein [Elusimicrobiota bacterium]